MAPFVEVRVSPDEVESSHWARR